MLVHETGGSLRHVALIATLPRRVVLLRRALASIAEQVRMPDRVVIVVDDPKTRIPLEVDEPGRGLEWLRNRRTPGAAGAWNTGLDELLRSSQDPASLVVSFLDDDDWWDRSYGAHVVAAFGPGVEVVAGTLVRHDARSPGGRPGCSPDVLTPQDFLRGNPGVQQSNLSARLSVLLEAGCFDEALSSCTDRDLGIRLADLGVGYRTAPEAVAHHDTTHALPRLSDASGIAKHAGLDTFFAKWRVRMRPEDVDAFTERARAFFGWSARTEPTVGQHAPSSRSGHSKRRMPCGSPSA